MKTTPSHAISKKKGNCGVSAKLNKQIAVEQEQLRRLLENYRPLLEKCAASPPTGIELSALAAMLHSFYNGIENIFKRVIMELDEPLPAGESWHQTLLAAMSETTSRRKTVISPELRDRLKEYMEFRHFFRHAYIFSLHWDRMRGLVLGSQSTLRQLETELDIFLRGTE